MAKIYFKNNALVSKLEPRKEVVSFLLNYSKSLSYIKVGNLKIENIAN
jgi:hypothetical protein